MSRAQDLKERHLGIFAGYFYCPYCQKLWWRGGHKEGFVKAAATRHVSGCWTVLVYVRHAIIPMGWEHGRQKFMSEYQAAKYPHILKSIKALVRKRKKDGYDPRAA